MSCLEDSLVRDAKTSKSAISTASECYIIGILVPGDIFIPSKGGFCQSVSRAFFWRWFGLVLVLVLVRQVGVREGGEVGLGLLPGGLRECERLGTGG